MTEKDKARKVTATGEMALDIVFKDDKPVDAVPGGSALNAIVSLARAGVGTSFVSATGNATPDGACSPFSKRRAWT